MVVGPIISLTVLSVRSFSLLLVNLLKYKEKRKWEAAAKQEKKRQAQAERDNSLYHKQKLEAAAKQEKERQAQAERDNCKDAKEKQERQARQERERETKKDQNSPAQTMELVHHSSTRSGATLQLVVVDRYRDAEEEQKRQGQQEREREAKKEQKRQAKLERELEMYERFRVMEEKIERLEREQIEAQRENQRMMKSFGQTIAHTWRLFMDSQRMHHSSYNHRTLEYQEHVKSLAYFDLPKDSDEDLQNIFNASFIDNPYNPFDATESSKHLNCERDIEYEDVHRLAMITVNGMLGHKNSQDITVLELNNQLFDDLEDDMVSSAIIPVSNVEGTRAKEEGNTYFKEQKFEEAIKCYSKSIDELPTVEAYGNRAMAYIKLNKFFEAEKDCTDALNIDDRYFKAYARRAIARTKLGCNLEGALEDVEVALKLESNNQEMNELLMSLKATRKAKDEGNNLYKHQKFEEAIKCYSVSINESPTAVAYCNRAMAYSKLDKIMEVENDCTNALKFDNQYFKAYARRAIAREKLGDNIKGALSDVEAALKLEPNSQEMKELHAKLIQKLG